MFPWNLFPFNKDMQSKMKQMRPEEVNQYVQKMMDNMFSSGFPHNMNAQKIMEDFQGFQDFQGRQSSHGQSTSQENISDLTYSIFETHEDIFVRIRIDSEEWLKELKVYHTSNLLMIEHIPAYPDKHSIPLPSLVKKKGSTAHYKDGILEIKIVKNIDMQYSEVDITELN